ncbi:hypothetical protein J3E69DRAFT_334026 [Trichoderma sp. SZMC 28015]
MGEFELGAASLSWHCTVSGSEVNLAASKSYGHGPDCCISFLTQPYSPKSSTDRHSGSGRQMNRCEPDKATGTTTNPSSVSLPIAFVIFSDSLFYYYFLLLFLVSVCL